jgi:hypothetical protein
MKDKLIRLADNFMAKKRSDGNILIVGLDDSLIYFTISGVSVELWEEMMSGKAVNQALADLIIKYPQHKTEFPVLVKNFLEDLKKHKIISIENK